MVNSLKHALELPRSSAMNNQDKCDPDWVGWHVFYGVLIPLYIVVGFSCSKTKHRTSLSVSTGHGCREQYTLHLGSFFKSSFYREGITPEGCQLACHQDCTPLLLYRVITLSSSYACVPQPGQGCMNMNKDPNVYESDKALPGYTHVNLRKNHLKVSEYCSKFSNNAKANIPLAPPEMKPLIYQEMLTPVPSTALLGSW